MGLGSIIGSVTHAITGGGGGKKGSGGGILGTLTNLLGGGGDVSGALTGLFMPQLLKQLTGGGASSATAGMANPMNYGGDAQTGYVGDDQFIKKNPSYSDQVTQLPTPQTAGNIMTPKASPQSMHAMPWYPGDPHAQQSGLSPQAMLYLNQFFGK